MKSKQPEKNFQRVQAGFVAYIRDPFNNPQPADVKPERMAAYRELFFNNIESFLSSNFPVMRTLLSDQQWLALAQDFFARHTCTTPYFSEIAEEFIDYLQHERNDAEDFPFMVELAHYEWVEMRLSIAQEALPTHRTVEAETIADLAVRLSPLAWPLAYQYPVHKISPQFIPLTPPEQPTFLLVYRDVQDDVHFIEINALTFQLLQAIEQNPGNTVSSYINCIAETLSPENPERLITHGLPVFEQLLAKSVIVPV